MASGRKLFARRGFDGASVRDITSDAGVNLGAVTYHFGSKRNLYGAVLENGLSPMVDRVGEAASKEGTPMERLRDVVEVFFDHLAENPDLPRLMLQEVAAGKPPPEQVVAIIRRNARNIVGILSDGWHDGSIRPGHPILTALSVVSQPVYMTVMSPLLREVAGIDLNDADTRTLVADHVKAFIHAGLSAPEQNLS